MSVANQANERLNALLQSSIRIEGLLKADEKKEKGKASSKTSGSNNEVAKDAIAISGLSTSMTGLLKAADKTDGKSGKKLKDFLVDFSSGIKTAAETVKDSDTKGLLTSLTGISSSIHKFAVGMSLVAILAPLVYVGTLVFSLSLKAIMWAVKSNGLLDKDTKDTTKLEGLLSLGKSLATFALVMVGIAVISPLYIIGVSVFVPSIKAIMSVLKTELLKKGETEAGGIRALLGLGKSLAGFALTMVSIALISPLYAIGVLAFVYSIKAIVNAIGETKVLKKDETEAGGIKSLISIGKSVALFAITMVGIALLVEPFAIGTIAFVFALLAMTKTLEAVGKKGEQVQKGLDLTEGMIKPLMKFGAVMIVAGLLAVPFAIGALVVTLSLLAVSGAAWVMGKLDEKGNITRAAGTMEKLALPMLMFGGSAAIVGSLVKDDPGTFALKMAVIGVAIVVLGLAAYVLGQAEVAPFVEAGALVLLTLGASLLVFSASMFLLSKSNFTKEQADNLGYSMWEIGKSVVKMGLLAPFMLLGAAALIPMSAALIPLGIALGLFKVINWKKEDGDAINNALTSMIQGFTGALKDITPMMFLSLLGSIALLGKLGTGLSSLAAGVKDMATLTFSGTRYNPKTGKLETVDKVKLTNEDIQAVGPNASAILTAMAKPLTEFGEWSVKGSIGFGSIRIGSSYMDKGIEAASKIGNILSTLAEGVGKMASLEITEYEVINAGTSKAKLVPKGTRKLSDADFVTAGENVTAILSAIVDPLTTFGEKFKDGSTWYTSSGLEAGIKGATMVGGIIAGLAEGVAKMASLEVVENIIINPGTKDAKIVPKGSRKLTPDDFKAAAVNVDSILNALITPLTDFGKKMKAGSTWITDSGLEAGIKGVAMISDPIAKLADTVVKMASGQITISEVINGKIVPKSVISFKDALPDAKIAMEQMLNMFPDVLIKFGESVKDKKDAIKTGMDLIPQFETSAKNVATIAEKYKSIIENLQTAKKTGIEPGPILTSFATSMGMMGNSFDKMLPNKLEMYKGFAVTTEGLTKIISPFEKFTKLFGQFTKDMGGFVTIWQKFGKDDTLNFKTYADSLKTISTVDVGKLSEVTKAIKEQSLNQSVNANQNNGGNQQQNSPGFLNTGMGGVGTNNVTPAVTTPTVDKTPSLRDQKPPETPIKAGTTIAELRVTNLYLNGKLQQ